MAARGFTPSAIENARAARRANVAARHAAQRDAEAHAARKLAAEQRAHSRDPRVKAYRAELPAFRRREAAKVADAAREFQRFLAAEAERQKGGRPASRTGKHRGPSILVPSRVRPPEPRGER